MLETGMTVEVGEAFCLEGLQEISGFLVGGDHCIISRSLLDNLSRYVLLSKETGQKEEQNFIWRGAVVSGVTTTAKGTVSTSREFMEALLEKREDYDRVLNANSALQKAFLKSNVSGKDTVSKDSFAALQESYDSEVALKEKIMAENMRLNARVKALEAEISKSQTQIIKKPTSMTSNIAKAQEARKTQSELTTAVILSCTLMGMETFDIQAELACRGLHNSQALISRQLSVKDAKDKERLKNIMQKYPDEFMGISDTAFDDFCERKMKKAEAKKARRSVSEWGE